MTVVRHDAWEFNVGDTWEMRFTCQKADGTPFEIDGLVSMTWRLGTRNRESTIVERTLAAGGITVVDAANGIVDVLISSADSDDIPVGTYEDELTATRDGFVGTMCEGTIRAKRKLPEIVP